MVAVGKHASSGSNILFYNSVVLECHFLGNNNPCSGTAFTGLEFHLGECKVILILQWVLPLENYKAETFEGHQGQDQSNRGHGL